MDTPVVEWAPFTLVDGTTEEQLFAASETLQREFLARQEGFVRRDLLRRDERAWCDLVVWQSREAEERAMERAAASPVCHRYFQLMEAADHAAPGAGVLLFERRHSYG